MKKIIFIIFVVNFLAFISCSTPRGARTKSSSKTSTRVAGKRGKAPEKEKPKQNEGYLEFSDTTIIELKPEEAKYLTPLEREFIKYVEAFNKEEYDKACSKMQTYAETFAVGDSLKYEAEFYTCECLIFKTDIDQAEEKLLELIKNPHINDHIRQKALVRLGQVYCYKDDKENAKKYFDLLATQFPNSIYLKVANCDLVKK
jgi:TolA-binding protein